MTDYLYRVRAYVDVDWVPRGLGGMDLTQNQANLPGYGTGATPGPGGVAQTMRFQAAEMVPNALTVAPTAANIGTAISSTATDIQGQITAAILGVIQGWATGGQ
jgi:hypothetical protein